MNSKFKPYFSPSVQRAICHTFFSFLKQNECNVFTFIATVLCAALNVSWLFCLLCLNIFVLAIYTSALQDAKQFFLPLSGTSWQLCNVVCYMSSFTWEINCSTLITLKYVNWVIVNVNIINSLVIYFYKFL